MNQLEKYTETLADIRRYAGKIFCDLSIYAGSSKPIAVQIWAKSVCNAVQGVTIADDRGILEAAIATRYLLGILREQIEFFGNPDSALFDLFKNDIERVVEIEQKFSNLYAQAQFLQPVTEE